MRVLIQHGFGEEKSFAHPFFRKNEMWGTPTVSGGQAIVESNIRFNFDRWSAGVPTNYVSLPRKEERSIASAR
ncbi:hypothetical protein [Leptospira santarosai]|uniref:hypothetical protein n=1 Tax=Leptospira santarosai TaxID=28183 RepID=UPI00062D3D78|nr:hypothetical protein [Leptospira santarosai]AVV50462.1 Uncharacterized protein XB17_01875 [Leptospira santarosai]MDO6382333.1 hypothetical protein [Leptospira santarosai]